MQTTGIVIVDSPVKRSELEVLARDTFTGMIKGVVDVKQRRIAFGGPLHADGEAVLLGHGSLQPDLWGFNLAFQDGQIEPAIQYTSLINIRPHQNNLAMEIRLPEVRRLVLEIIKEKVLWES